jgi:hypothetical protein
MLSVVQRWTWCKNLVKISMKSKFQTRHSRYRARRQRPDVILEYSFKCVIYRGVWYNDPSIPVLAMKQPCFVQVSSRWVTHTGSYFFWWVYVRTYIGTTRSIYNRPAYYNNVIYFHRMQPTTSRYSSKGNMIRLMHRYFWVRCHPSLTCFRRAHLLQAK